MAISVNWLSMVITIPQSYLTLISSNLYELDVNELRLDLKDLEDDDIGMSFPDTHIHNTEVTISGVTYARTFQIVNGYTVTFEDVGSPYTVRCTGANHNLADVKNLNQVSLIIGNSAGLIVTSSGGSGEADWTIPERNQIRHRLGIDGASSLPTATPSLATLANQSIIIDDIDALDGKVDLVDDKVDAALTDLGAIESKIDTIDSNVDVIGSIVGDIQTKVTTINHVESGNWEIKNNQMIFYKTDGSELMRFNLLDSSGVPTMTNVFKRAKV